MKPLKVLMLGWEFPPFITGGLGTACYGLTKAMDHLGCKITFVLPKSISGQHASHVTLRSRGDVSTDGPEEPVAEDEAPPPVPARQVEQDNPESSTEKILKVLQQVDFLELPIEVPSVYDTPEQAAREISSNPQSIWFLREQLKQHGTDALPEGTVDQLLTEVIPEAPMHEPEESGGTDHEEKKSGDYGGDLFEEAQRYARFALDASRNVDFDIIHAHDWLTYAGGLAVARLSGKPLVVHVHSTEFDRSGEHVNQPVYDIERRGMHGAMRVIAVSQLTKNIIVNRYGIHPDKVDVVYNGVEFQKTEQPLVEIHKQDKIVLYFGRITMQKGPEYFIAAAKRVLEVMDNVKFVVAGSGDLAARMIEMAAENGIGHKVLFTGFLRGKDIERVFSMADMFVMPSVSEPFGIAPLEAMSYDVPVLISKSSGVSEVLTHALKVDFWDVDDMADKIIAVLKYPPLSKTLKEGGRFEVRQLTWDGAARRCIQVYEEALSQMTLQVAP